MSEHGQHDGDNTQHVPWCSYQRLGVAIALPPDCPIVVIHGNLGFVYLNEVVYVVVMECHGGGRLRGGEVGRIDGESDGIPAKRSPRGGRGRVDPVQR